MTRHRPDLAARLYARAPDLDAMWKRLPDLGESLNTAALDLAHDLDLEKIDTFLAKLKGAETSLMHLRRALAERVSGDGTG